MATVNTGLWVAGFNLPPGQQHHWQQNGQTFGRVRWFIAQPLSLLGVERAVEVVRVFSLVTAGGVRQINVIVRNVGTESANYSIFFAETGS
ncbi:hypothetical protein BH18ACI4_BH18ACI4_01480 [soil metagenome]